jgi:hypothetical protein
MEENIPSRALSRAPAMAQEPVGSDDHDNNGSVRTNEQLPSVVVSCQELVSLSTIDKLRGSENYDVWKFQMTIIFRARKLFGIVNGTIRRETSKNEEDWLDKDVACHSILIAAIDQKIIRWLMICRSAHAMWRRLSTVHEQNATESIQFVVAVFRAEDEAKL